MIKSELREKVVDEFKSLVFGPRTSDDEFIEGPRGLALRYLTGILFPQGEKRSDLANDDDAFSEEEDSSESKIGEDFSGDADNPLSMANEELPSSVGITFVIKKDEDFKIICSAARYERLKQEKPKISGFKRIQLDESILQAKKTEPSQNIFDDRAKIHVFRRKSLDRKDCQIVTVSLENVQKKDDFGPTSIKNTQKRLYQVKLKCVANNRKIKPYDVIKSEFSDLEENILSLQYSDSPVYAIGHGASVDWKTNESKEVNSVEVSYTPVEIVNRPIFDRLELSEDNIFNDKDVFDIAKLSDVQSDKDKLIAGFYNLCNFYEKWIENEEKNKKGKFIKAEKYLIKEMKECAERIRKGIEALKNNNHYWQSFVLANRAMLLQMLQSQKLDKLRATREKENKSWPIEWHEEIDPSIDINSITDENKPYWRPFQLAFFLMCFLDLEEEGKENRKIADLIWFSTGGGKTEAYLFLACYELLRRRTRYTKPEMGYGTGVLTRYTLRFLTADQFSRTTSLGCALEKVRRDNKELLGEEQFTIGLFVGATVSYNTIAAAQDGLIDLKENLNARHLFHITECPNCGTGLIPKENKSNEGGPIKGLGIEVLNDSVIYKCQNSKCLFHEIKIPVKIVDEEIYNSPPSFILGTIDKFAAVTWNADAGKIFGCRKVNNKVAPPSLIIQDEIHLISGPLGTIGSIYESGFDTLIKTLQKDCKLEATGPKYIASSATVRDSEKQLKRLLGRHSKIFPPRGLRIQNSFFANIDKDPNNGRLYIGIMPQAFRSTSAAHAVCGAFLQSVRYIAKEENSKEALDFLWTTLCYCNSKRELGLINSSVNQEILERMKVCCDAQSGDRDEIEALIKEEISADMSNTIAETSEALKTSNNDRSVVDFVPTTNMISVGIDIDRLGSMIVNGQPKTTSEYIQASSRVGRRPDLIGPGAIVALYSPAKPRDRSHYEQFKSYHQKLYRLVEPTSVTPGSAPALYRALHAAIVLLIRHGIRHMRENHAAGSFDINDQNIQNLVSDFKKRLVNIYNENDFAYERDIITKHIDQVIETWSEWSEHNLYYNKGFNNDRSVNSLLIAFNNKQSRNRIGFRTMHSMRNVDTEVIISHD